MKTTNDNSAPHRLTFRLTTGGDRLSPAGVGLVVSMSKSQLAASFLETASTRVRHTRAPIERMVRVYSALKERRMVNCTTMARDLEVSVRSVSRDIEFMRDRL